MPKVNFEETNKKTLTKLGTNLTVFSAPSSSRPGSWHFVVVYPDERGITCTCEGWRYNRKCWHIDAIPLCMAKEPEYGRVAITEKGLSSTFNMTAIAECYYVEGHEGGHSWE